MKNKLTFLALFLFVITSMSFAQVTINGSVTNYTTIQAAMQVAVDGNTIMVGPGTYSGNIKVNKNITLLSVDGAATTIIDGNNSGGELGTVQLTPGRNGVQIGSSGHGFTIKGIDGTAGLEKAALYLQGSQTNITIEGNVIEALGDAALMGEYNAVNNNIFINDNVLTGQTFLGANPAGDGFAAQFTLLNVPRQAVVFGGGAGTTNAQNFTFTNNTISTLTGGVSITNNTGTPMSPHPQGNTLVTLDLVGTNVITGNTFSGTTTRYAEALRARGSGSYNISGNTFNGSFPYYFTAGTSVPAIGEARALNVVNNNIFGDTFGAVLAGNTILPAGNIVDPNNMYVNVNAAVGGNGSFNYPFQNISAGITAVLAGGTVNVAVGTYNENATTPVYPGKKVSFVGETDGSGNPLTTIKGSLYLDNNDGMSITGIRFEVDSKDLLTLKNTNGLTIKNCVFDGNGLFLSGGKNGINHVSGPNGNSDVTVEDCLFTNGLYVGIGSRITNLTVKNSTFENIKSGINQMGGNNLVVENCDFNVVAQASTSDTYCIRFASDVTQDLTITGSTFVVNKNGFTALPPDYHAAIIVRANAGGILKVNNSSILGEVVNLSTVNINATYNWWGDATGALDTKTLPNIPNYNNPGGLGSAVSPFIDYKPWYVDEAMTTLSNAARFMKLTAKNLLLPYQSDPDKKIRKAVEKAIESIDKSLDSELWADANHLTKKGKKVFDEEKHAVQELTDKKFGSLFSEAINHLVAADLTLAQVAIDDAVAACNGEKDCQKEIDKANNEMAKAEAELAKGKDDRYDNAIDHYKKAWEHAQKAAKKSYDDEEGSIADNSESVSIDNSTNIPESFTLNQNYPNPFNPSTVIKFGLPEASFVTLKIYNMLGQEIKTLVSSDKAAGYYNIQWNGDNNFGNLVASGTYIYRITAGSNVVNKKMILMK